MDGDKACTATFTLNAPAGLSASNDGPTALGSVTTLSATITDGINVTYAWNFGDGRSSNLRNPTNVFGGVGTFTVSLTVTDDGGKTDTITHPITITATTQDGSDTACSILDHRGPYLGMSHLELHFHDAPPSSGSRRFELRRYMAQFSRAPGELRIATSLGTDPGCPVDSLRLTQSR